MYANYLYGKGMKRNFHWVSIGKLMHIFANFMQEMVKISVNIKALERNFDYFDFSSDCNYLNCYIYFPA
jgi:hypothetical protein